jgi:hypothetical protein
MTALTVWQRRPTENPGHRSCYQYNSYAYYKQEIAVASMKILKTLFASEGA